MDLIDSLGNNLLTQIHQYIEIGDTIHWRIGIFESMASSINWNPMDQISKPTNCLNDEY